MDAWFNGLINDGWMDAWFNGLINDGWMDAWFNSKLSLATLSNIQQDSRRAGAITRTQGNPVHQGNVFKCSAA